MGKRIIKVSVSSWRSILSLYGKVATLLFALVCVASGQTAKTAAAGIIAEKSGKGRALFAADSSIARNVKLFLGNEICPVYGIGSTCSLSKLDSTSTNANGYFVFSTASPLSSGFSIMTDSLPYNNKKAIFVSKRVTPVGGSDSTYTFYLSPVVRTAIAPKPKASPVNQLSINHGENVTVKIPELASAIKSASVINIKGETITALQADASGAIRWNTQSTAKGIYFLNVKSSLKNMNVKVVLQ